MLLGFWDDFLTTITVGQIMFWIQYHHWNQLCCAH